MPSDQFDAVTESKVKNFQRDYMKMGAPTGVVDEETAKAVDEFGGKFSFDFNDLKCTCGKCTGFGNGKFKNEYSSTNKVEAYYKYEYPGIHRMLLWGLRGLKHHIESEMSPFLKIGVFYSTYRCWGDNTKNSRTSTNHMGKAADLHIFTKTTNKDWHRPTDKTENIKLCNKVRDVCVSKMGAQIKWNNNNQFGLEPPIGTVKADSWVHIDVRTYDNEKYLQDKYFIEDFK